MGNLIFYGIIAALIAGAFATTYFKGRSAGKEAVTAELQPKLDACAGQVKALGTQIVAQNDAVAALRAEGEARVARATKDAARAKEAASGARSEAERLRQAGKQAATGACPAADGVAEVRRGLGALRP